MIDVIQRNAKREMRLVGDLLLLVRIEAGRFELAARHGRPAADREDVGRGRRPRGREDGMPPDA